MLLHFLVLSLLVLSSYQSNEFKLSWEYISPLKLEGRFEDLTYGTGLHFQATEYSLHLTNTKGAVLVSYAQMKPLSLEREDFSLSVMGNFYPPNVTDLAMADVEGYLMSEAKYLLHLYYAMEKLGINGPEMPAAKGLYRIVLGYQKHVAKFGPNADCKCNCPTAVSEYPECLASSHSPAQCADCLGMCGACGSCLSSFCGNCCWYPGCCGHDICCYSGSSAACLFPIGLTCGSVYKCNGYDTSCCNEAPKMPQGKTDGNKCRVQTWGCEPPADGSCCRGDWECPRP